MIKKNIFIYKLFSLTWQVLLISYLLLVIINALTKEFVAYYIDFDIFLLLLIFFGIIVLWLQKKKE